MKIFIFIALVATCFAAPASKSTKAVNWPAVTVEVVKIRQLIRTSLETVVSDATSDNTQVGSDIGVITARSAATARTTINDLQAQVDAQTLTVAQAKTVLQSLEVLLLTTREECLPLIEKLTEPTQLKISTTFANAYTEAKAVSDKIYGLLAA